MRKLSDVLTEVQLRLPAKEQKKILRKILISEREKFSKISKEDDWGARQFFRALELLKISVAEINIKNRKFLISCFFPIKNELNIACFADEKWIFPRIFKNGELKWFEFGDGKSGLVKNEYGIFEKPEDECFEYTSNMPPLICFLPGLAASYEGHRLGYGGGFYDRFLKKMKKNIISVLCLPSKKFIFESIPFEENDEKVDLVVW